MCGSGSDTRRDRHDHAPDDPSGDISRNQAGAPSARRRHLALPSDRKSRSGTKAPAARWPTSTSRMKQDEHLKIGGLLYSWISLKDLPDATFPGILRELVVMDFPLVVNAEVTLPDQSKVDQAVQEPPAQDDGGPEGYSRRLPDQRGCPGGGSSSWSKVLQDVISSSLKACQMSLHRDHADVPAQPEPDGTGRGGTDPVGPSAAALPRARADERRREEFRRRWRKSGSSSPAFPPWEERTGGRLDLLTLNAADLLPVEMPWRGTQHSPLMLFETPYRQLVPFSPFDPSSGTPTC